MSTETAEWQIPSFCCVLKLRYRFMSHATLPVLCVIHCQFPEMGHLLSGYVLSWCATVGSWLLVWRAQDYHSETYVGSGVSVVAHYL